MKAAGEVIIRSAGKADKAGLEAKLEQFIKAKPAAQSGEYGDGLRRLTREIDAGRVDDPKALLDYFESGRAVKDGADPEYARGAAAALKQMNGTGGTAQMQGIRNFDSQLPKWNWKEKK